MSYTTLSTQEKQKNHYLKKFLNKTIFYSVHPFAHIRQHSFSKYWGTNDMGRPPPQIFGGAVPQSPQGLRPWSLHHHAINDNIWRALEPLGPESPAHGSQRGYLGQKARL